MTHRSWKQVGLFLLGLFLPSLLFFSSSAWACSCAGKVSPAEALERSDAVFMGEIVAIKPSLEEEARNEKEGKFIFVTDYEYQVKVEKAWKGVWGDTVSIEIGVQGTACGLGRLNVGQRILFYAYGSSTKYFFLRTPFHTDSCTRTRPADYAVVEGLFLDAAVQKVDPAPIYRQLPTILKSHGNPLYRAAAARYLARDTPSPLPEDTGEALLAGLKDSNPIVRRTVAKVITYPKRYQPFWNGPLKKYRHIWAGPLNEAFKKEEKLVKKNGDSKIFTVVLRSIANALVAHGDGDALIQTIPYFIMDLKSEQYSVLSNSIGRLWDIGPDAQVAVPALKQMLEHEDEYIRKGAKGALKAIQSLP
jgi:hypothetical protein